MSLTSFLKIPDVKEKFASQFPLPSFNLNCPIKAAPVTKHFPLIGTAFDYLLRFYIESLNPNVVTKPWVAEYALKLTEDYPELHNVASKLLRYAKKHYTRYKASKELTDETIKATIYLAQLDPIYRANVIDPNLGIADEGDIQDLRNLINIVDTSYFKSNRHCLLNPVFCEGSSLVGGADADAIIDKTLIDIKTTKNLEFSREYFNQLVGYYILSKVGEIEGFTDGKISYLAIYYSRFGVLHKISSDSIEETSDFRAFIDWFVKRAQRVWQQIE